MSVPPPQGMTLPPEAPPISPGPGGNPPMVPPPMKPIASVGFRPMPGGGGGPMPMPRTPMSGFPQPGQQGGMPGSGVVPGGGMNSPLMQYYMSLMNRNPMMGRGRY
jgi:hypothetical protein